MKRILFPFEVSMDNRNGFVHAVKLARKLGKDIVLLNAVVSIPAEDETDFKEQVRKNWIAAQDEVLGLQGYYLREYTGGELDRKGSA